MGRRGRTLRTLRTPSRKCFLPHGHVAPSAADAQFYCWYFHSLPLLLWGAGLPAWAGAGTMALVEVSFNVFPATPWSSAILQACHAAILVIILLRKWPAGSADAPREGRAVKEE